MRMNKVCLIGFALAVTPLLSAVGLSAVGLSAVPGHPATPSSQVIRVAQTCPPGEYWEESGYVAEGKWRQAHCAKVNGRQ